MSGSNNDNNYGKYIIYNRKDKICNEKDPFTKDDSVALTWNGDKKIWTSQSGTREIDDKQISLQLAEICPMADYKKLCGTCGEGVINVNLYPDRFTLGTDDKRSYQTILQNGEMHIFINGDESRILWVSRELIVEYSSSIAQANKLVMKAFPKARVTSNGLFRISSKDGKLNSVIKGSGSLIAFVLSDKEKLSSILSIMYLYMREIKRTYNQQYYEFADSLLTLFNGAQICDKSIISLELLPTLDQIKISLCITRGEEEVAEVFGVLIPIGRDSDSKAPESPLKDKERSGISSREAVETKSADPITNKGEEVVECSSPVSKRVKLEQDKYIINFKKRGISEDAFPNILFDTNGNRFVEEDVKSAFEGCKSASTFINTIVSTFQIDRDRLVDELLSYIQLPGKSINLDRDSNVWGFEVKGLKKIDLDKIEQQQIVQQEKLNQMKGKLESDQKEHNDKISTLDSVLKLLKLGNHNKLQDHIEEMQKSYNALCEEAENLRNVVHLLHDSPDEARKKAEYLSKALSPGSSLKHTSLDELTNRIDEMARSYKKTGELSSELESFYQQPDSLLLGTFPMIKEEVSSKYRYFTDSYNKLSSHMIIAEAIKSKLADPQLRSKFDLDINALNKELQQYSLAIEEPQRGLSADPSRHKFVGYDSGGTRGQVSSVVAWGLIELENGTYKRTIYKSEVRMFQ